MTTQPYTPAPRPAACDLDAARKLARQLAGTTNTGTVAWDAALAIRALAADLAATRAERDALRAALPPADTLWNAALLLRDYGSGAAVGMAGDLERRSDRIRALATAPAPVPAADVAGVLPAFLVAAAVRRNGGAG